MNRSRKRLLVLLIPLLAAIAAVSLHELPSALTQLAVNEDGHLIGLSIDETLGIPRELSVWDLTTGRKQLNRLPPRSGHVMLSPRGRWLMVEDDTNQMVVVEIASGRRIDVEPRVSLSNSIWQFSHNGEYLALIQNGALVVWECDSWRVVSTTRSVARCVAVSDDGALVAVDSNNGPLRVLDTQTGEETEIGQPASPAFLLRFSPDGERLMSRSGNSEIWNRRSRTRIKLPVIGGSVRDIASSPDSSVFALLMANGNVRVVDWKMGHRIAVFPAFYGGEFSLNGDYYAIDGSNVIVRYDGATGEVTRSSPISPSFYGYTAIVSLAYIAWSVLWVRSGDRGRFRPFLDLCLIWTIAIVGVAMRVFGGGSMYDVYRSSLHVGMICFASLIGFIVIWAAVSDARWSLRAQGLLGLTAIVMSPTLVFENFDWFLWQMVIGVLSLIVTLFLLLRLWDYAVGCRLQRIDGEGCEPGVAGASGELAAGEDDSVEKAFQPQFPLRDLLISTAAAAVAVSVAMHFRPTSMPFPVLLYAICHSVATSFCVTAACWLALGRDYLPWRILAFSLVALLGGSVSQAFPSVNLVAPWWSAVQPGLTALAIAASLLVFRLHGYRLLTNHQLIVLR